MPKPGPSQATDDATAPCAPSPCSATPPSLGGSRYRPWAELLRKTFAVDVETCPRCGGRMRLMALITEPQSLARFLRRKAFEARTEVGDLADIAIGKIRGLFRVEHEATAIGIVGTPEHLALRQEKSKPIVDDFFDWVLANKDGILPKSPLAAALGYAINQRKRLELFLSDPRIPIHNNSSERRLRVVALGRKNFLFFGNPRAGRNIAGLYSLVGSCIANRVEPTEYLTDVLARVHEGMGDAELDALLPDRWRPPAFASLEYARTLGAKQRVRAVP